MGRRTTPKAESQGFGKSTGATSFEQQMIKDTSNLSWKNTVGAPFTLRNNDESASQVASFKAAVSGIARLEFVAMPGVQSTGNNAVSSVQLAADQLFSVVRHANSGKANYEPVDLMLYFLASSNLHMYYEWMKRVYGVVKASYSAFSAYQPRILLSSMNVNATNILQNIDSLRTYINSYAQAVNAAVAVPKTLRMVTRHRSLCSHVFKDAENEQAQLYVFEPSGFWRYSPRSATTGGEMAWDSLTGELTLSDIVALGDKLLTAIVDEEDIVSIMRGDVIKAYGTDLQNLPPVDATYGVKPEFNSNALLQIHNATVLPHVSASIGQSEGLMRSIVKDVDPTTTNNEIQTKAEQLVCSLDRLIDLPFGDPSPDDTYAVTALMGMRRSDGTYAVGTEYLRDVSIYTRGLNAANTVKLDRILPAVAQGTGYTQQFVDQEVESARLHKFGCAPMQYLWLMTWTDANKSVDSLTLNAINTDLDVYAVMTLQTLENIHDARARIELGIG